MHRYFPDFYVKVRTKENKVKKWVVEVKPKAQTTPPKTPKRKTKKYLNEVRTYAINRATNRINNALGSLTSGRGIPRNMGGVFQTNAYNSLARNPFAGETVIYPEDLGSNDQGHYVQFYINEQTNANINFQGKSPSYAPNGSQLRGGTSTASIKRAYEKTFSSICMYMLQRLVHRRTQSMVK